MLGRDAASNDNFIFMPLLINSAMSLSCMLLTFVTFIRWALKIFFVKKKKNVVNNMLEVKKRSIKRRYVYDEPHSFYE